MIVEEACPVFLSGVRDYGGLESIVTHNYRHLTSSQALVLHFFNHTREIKDDIADFITTRMDISTLRLLRSITDFEDAPSPEDCTCLVICVLVGYMAYTRYFRGDANMHFAISVENLALSRSVSEAPPGSSALRHSHVHVRDRAGRLYDFTDMPLFDHLYIKDDAQ